MEESVAHVDALGKDVRALAAAKMRAVEELEMAQQNLRDALVSNFLIQGRSWSQADAKNGQARERRQEESSRSLITAQQELEAAYAEAVAQRESWKNDNEATDIEEEHGQYRSASRVTLPETDEDEMERLDPDATRDGDEVSRQLLLPASWAAA